MVRKVGLNINVTLPKKIGDYIKKKSKKEYLPISAVARQYIAQGVSEEMILDYHRKGYSITRIAELVDTPIERVMEVLSKLNEELHDINEELEDIEKGRLTL
jgi:hypothetical protein